MVQSVATCYVSQDSAFSWFHFRSDPGPAGLCGPADWLGLHARGGVGGLCARPGDPGRVPRGRAGRTEGVPLLVGPVPGRSGRRQDPHPPQSGGAQTLTGSVNRQHDHKTLCPVYGNFNEEPLTKRSLPIFSARIPKATNVTAVLTWQQLLVSGECRELPSFRVAKNAA